MNPDPNLQKLLDGPGDWESITFDGDTFQVKHIGYLDENKKIKKYVKRHHMWEPGNFEKIRNDPRVVAGTTMGLFGNPSFSYNAGIWVGEAQYYYKNEAGIVVDMIESEDNYFSGEPFECCSGGRFSEEPKSFETSEECETWIKEMLLKE